MGEERTNKQGGYVMGRRGGRKKEVQQGGGGVGGELARRRRATKQKEEVRKDGGMVGETVRIRTGTGIVGRGSGIKGRKEDDTGTGQA